MNHPLSVYSIVYVAILFVTVSIWGSGLAQLCGDGRILAASIGVFALKLAIDDYIHFQAASRRLHADLWLSLLMYLLLALSIGGLGSNRGRLSAGAFAGVFAVGTAWIRLTDSVSGSSAVDDGVRRRRGWLLVNFICLGLLLWTVVAEPQVQLPVDAGRKQYTSASIPLVLLFCVLVFDFAYFGTLKRLASLGAAANVDAEQPAELGTLPLDSPHAGAPLPDGEVVPGTPAPSGNEEGPKPTVSDLA